jgi:hypothetical protein
LFHPDFKALIQPSQHCFTVGIDMLAPYADVMVIALDLANETLDLAKLVRVIPAQIPFADFRRFQLDVPRERQE